MRPSLRRNLTIETITTNVASPLTTPVATPAGTPVPYIRNTPTSTPGGTPGATPRATPRGSPAGTPRSTSRSVTESAVSLAARASAGAAVHAAQTVELSPEEKRDIVLAEPKFGMFSMTKYFLRSSNTTIYLFLPLIVFLGQWMMFVSVVAHNLKMPASVCEGGSAPEMKLLFISVCLVYFSQSVQLFEDLRRRGAKRVKMTPEASYTIMLDKLHEHAFTLMVHVTNLWVVYATDNVLEAMFNCLAMSFLSDLENEWQTAYYANRLGEAADVYDTVFVTHRENARKMLTRRKRACFRCVHAAASVVFTVTLAGYALMPVFAAGMLVVGVLCK
jgi:hypothetical protein